MLQAITSQTTTASKYGSAQLENKDFLIPEMVTAIASLWPLVLILVSSSFIFIFRKNLGIFIEKFNVIKLKRGETEITVTPEKSDIGVKTQTMEEPAAEKPSRVGTDETEKSEIKTAGDWSRIMILAFINKKFTEAEDAYKQMQLSESIEVNLLRNEVRYLRFRYEFAADQTALTKLNELTKKEEISFLAYKAIGICYEQSGHYDKAAQAYQEAVKVTDDEEKKSEEAVNAAKALMMAGQTDNAFILLFASIHKTTLRSALATIYEGLSELYDRVTWIV